MNHLTLIKDQSVIKHFSLTPGMNTLGRSKSQDIMIDDENVTRAHARIQVDTECKIFLFEDLGSLNGSYINKMKVSKHLLAPGDVIQVGSHELKFSTSEP